MADGLSDKRKSNMGIISVYYRLKTYKKFYIYIFILILIILYAILLFSWRSLTKYDTALFLEIFDNRIPAIESFFVLWTNEGTFLFIALIVIILWLKGEKTPAVYLALGLIIDAILVDILKAMIHRPRPFEVLPIIPLELGDNFGSLPSGHTSRAFLSATILSNFYRKHMAAFFLIAVSIGISRIYVGVHYPLDVLIGAITGSLIGFFLVNLLDRLGIGKML